GGVWVRNRKEGMTEMEYQMRNWYYFNWLCGDHIVEQHVHNIDVMNWFKGGIHPVKAQGMGGRQVRVGPEFGEIYDHHYVEFVYEDGSVMNSQCRHQQGTMSRVTEILKGQNGTVMPGRILDKDGKTIWRFKGQNNDPYQTEHDVLYQHIREDKPINNTYYTAESTMTAILGRMATYSGKELSWDEALNSEISLMPDKFAWDADPGPKKGEDGLYPCAIPGDTTVV
ncbi:MAG: dehydrogenase, partial [Verrucomicrobiales bacterium]